MISPSFQFLWPKILALSQAPIDSKYLLIFVFTFLWASFNALIIWILLTNISYVDYSNNTHSSFVGGLFSPQWTAGHIILNVIQIILFIHLKPSSNFWFTWNKRLCSHSDPPVTSSLLSSISFCACNLSLHCPGARCSAQIQWSPICSCHLCTFWIIECFLKTL